MARSSELPGASSQTNLRGARITGSVLATGTGSSASMINAAGDEAMANIHGLIAAVRSRVDPLRDDPGQVVKVAQLEGTVTELERQLEAPEPDRRRVGALLSGLLSAGADLTTVAPVVAALVAAVRGHLGL